MIELLKRFWKCAIGIIVAVVVSIITDGLKKTHIWGGVWTALKWVWDGICSVMVFAIPVWAILLTLSGSVILVLAWRRWKKRKKPEWLNLTSFKHDGIYWRWKWEWLLDEKRYGISDLVPFCQACKRALEIDDSLDSVIDGKNVLRCPYHKHGRILRGSYELLLTSVENEIHYQANKLQEKTEQ